MFEKIIAAFFVKEEKKNKPITVISCAREVKIKSFRTISIEREEMKLKKIKESPLKPYFEGLRGLKGQNGIQIKSLRNRQEYARFDGCYPVRGALKNFL